MVLIIDMGKNSLFRPLKKCRNNFHCQAVPTNYMNEEN